MLPASLAVFHHFARGHAVVPRSWWELPRPRGDLLLWHACAAVGGKAGGGLTAERRIYRVG